MKNRMREICTSGTVRGGDVGDGRVGTVLAARDMPAERRRAATLDRRHHLQLAEADMAGVGLTPRRSVAAEDIRDLQSGTHHAGRALGRRLGPLGGQQRETIERTDDRADHVGRDLRVECRRVDLGWPSKT